MSTTLENRKLKNTTAGLAAGGTRDPAARRRGTGSPAGAPGTPNPRQPATRSKRGKGLGSPVTPPGGALPRSAQAAEPAARTKREGGHCRPDTRTMRAPHATNNDLVGHVGGATRTPPAGRVRTTNGKGRPPIATQSGSALPVPEHGPRADGVAPPDTDLPAGADNAVAPTLADLIASIREWGSQRVTTMYAQNALINKSRALAKRAVGWSPVLPAAERLALAKAGAEIVAAIERGKPVGPTYAEQADAIRGMVLVLMQARHPLDAYRKRLEEQMTEAAEQLPVWRAWGEGVRGFGLLGLATLVSELGDMTTYANPAKCWKRLGLAPSWCYAVETKGGREATAIPKQRRSRSWVIADSLLRADNPYRELYRARKQYEAEQHPEFKTGVSAATGRITVTKHCDLRSRRYSEKRFIRDLWRAWRRAAGMPDLPAHPLDATAVATEGKAD